MNQLNILVDYLTISIKQMQLSELLEILKLNMNDMVRGYSRYLGQRLYMGGIQIHYGDYIILEMSGKGCRFLESLNDNKLNWVDFIEQFLCLEGSHLARLDIACDDKPEKDEKPYLSFDTMLRHVDQHRYVSMAHKKTGNIFDEKAIYFGSPQSDRRLRIYDKALERKYDGHWIRAEFQLRNDCALSFFMRALELSSIGRAYQGMLFDFLRFTREVNDENHTERLTVTRWWKSFCGNAKKIKGFYVGGLEYNLEKLEHYLYKNAGSSMKTMLACHGGDVGKLIQFADQAEYNEQQKFLVKTQPLISKMYADYEPDRMDAKLPPRSEILLIKEDERINRMWEDKIDYYNHFGMTEAQRKQEEESARLCAEDLPF